MLGYRASIWYRYDGGWINRVDNAGDITESNANHTGTTAARFALLWQPNDNVKVTPSVMFQNKQQHDLSTYWPAYSDPGAGRFNNATPELIPIPDVYYLPAIKVQVDFAHLTFISNSSYYHRNETDSYQGTAFDLAYYQALGWPNSLYPGAPALGCGAASTTGDRALLVVSAARRAGHSHAARIRELLDAEHHDQRSALLDAGVSPAVERPRCPREVDGGRVLAARAGTQHRAAHMTRTSIRLLSRRSIGVDPDSIYGSVLLLQPATGTPQPAALPMPNCDIYYNYNKSYDRQIAGFGEATIRLVDGLSLVAGARYSKLGFSLNHYSNGYENYGPFPAARQAVEHRVHAASRSQLAGRSRTTCSTSRMRRDFGPAASTHR